MTAPGVRNAIPTNGVERKERHSDHGGRPSPLSDMHHSCLRFMHMCTLCYVMAWSVQVPDYQMDKFLEGPVALSERGADLASIF